MIFPWPSRKLRQEAIIDARREKEQSRSDLAHAAAIEMDLERLAGPHRIIPVVRADLNGHDAHVTHIA